MNNHTFEERVVLEKGLLNKIEAGECAECIVRNIHLGRIHTTSFPYDEKLSEDG